MLYPIEQTSKLFDQLPPELSAAILSQDTADAIRQICERHKIIDKMSALAILIGNVLLGLLSPDSLATAMTQELKIPTAKAKIIAQEISRLIFYPVRDKLAEFYKETSPAPGTEMVGPDKQPPVISPVRNGVSNEVSQPAIINIPQNEPSGIGDTYRETVE